MRKGILSKLLSDVENLENLREENTPLLTEEESLNLAEEIAQDIEEYATQESDANFITSTIAEVEEKKSDIEVGLQSDINPQIASLLLSNLNKSISKLDSNAIIDQAGLQSDNKDRILRDGLLSADNVLSKAWEALKKLWEDIKKKGLSIIAKLRKFFADRSKKIKEKISSIREKMKNKNKAGLQSDSSSKLSMEEYAEQYIKKFLSIITLEEDASFSKVKNTIDLLTDKSNIVLPLMTEFGYKRTSDRTKDWGFSSDLKGLAGKIEKFDYKNKGLFSEFEGNKEDSRIGNGIEPVILSGKAIGILKHLSVDGYLRLAHGEETKLHAAILEYEKIILPEKIEAGMIDSFSGKIEIPSEKEITDTLNFIEKKTNDYSSYSKEMDKGIADWEKYLTAARIPKKEEDSTIDSTKHVNYVNSKLDFKYDHKMSSDMFKLAIDSTNQYMQLMNSLTWYCDASLDVVKN